VVTAFSLDRSSSFLLSRVLTEIVAAGTLKGETWKVLARIEGMKEEVFGYLQRRRKARLYKQWMEKEGLSAEDIPQDVLGSKKGGQYRQPIDEVGSYPEDYSWEEEPQSTDSGLIRIPVRYIWLGLSLIMLLLVTLSIVSTVLIMRSC